MTPHDIAIHRIESELKYIPTSILPVHIAERACMAAYLSYELSVITAQERDDLLKRIRAAEIIRFRELLEAAA